MGIVAKDKPRNYFYKEKFVLKIFGISFTGNESIIYRVYGYSVIFCTIVAYPFLAFGDLFKHDFDVMADVLMYEICTLVGLAKTAVLLRYRLKFGKIMDKFEQEPFLPNHERGGDAEEKLINNCVWITSAQSLTYWIFAVISLSLATGFTLIKRLKSSDYHDWQFAYGPLTVLNVTYSPNFEISMMYQNFNMIVLGDQFCTTDVLTAAVLAHISCQFKMLQNYFGRLAHNSYRAMTLDINGTKCSGLTENTNPAEIDIATIPWKYLKLSLEDFVRYHLAVAEIVREVEELFSGLLLLVFLGALGAICFNVYHASLIPLNDFRLVRTTTEIVSMCLQIVTVCYWGDQVLFESQQVGRAAYEANFVGADLRFQKGIALVIRRSQNISKLTAGKFTDVSLPTFAWIIRTAFSTFMILHKANTRKH